MRINVVPTKKVGEIEFGMVRDRVRTLLGDAKEFYKFETEYQAGIVLKA